MLTSRQKAYESTFIDKFDKELTKNIIPLLCEKPYYNTLSKLYDRINKLGYKISLTDAAKDFLSDKGYDPQYGARPVKRLIQKEVLNALSKEILSGELKTDSIILIDSFDEKLVLRNQNDLILN